MTTPTPFSSEAIRHEPAFMLGVIPGLVWPQLRIEIKVTAAVPAAAAS